MLIVLKNILILLHPQCPFITEEIYLMMFKNKDSILKEKWPSKIENMPKENSVDMLIKIMNAIRRIRLENNINNLTILEINILTKNNMKIFEKNKEFLNEYLILVNSKVVSISNVSIIGNKITEVIGNFTIEVPYTKNIGNEIQKLKKIIEKLEFEIDRSNKILSNNNFITKAPKTKVDEEKLKLKLYQEQLKNAIESLDNLEEDINN